MLKRLCVWAQNSPIVVGALDLQRAETETETSPTGSRDYQTTVSAQTILSPDHGVSYYLKLTPVCICRWDRSRGPQHGTSTPTTQVCRDNKLLTWSRWFYTSGTVAHHQETAQTSPSQSQSLPARVLHQSLMKKWLTKKWLFQAKTSEGKFIERIMKFRYKILKPGRQKSWLMKNQPFWPNYWKYKYYLKSDILNNIKWQVLK